MTTKQHSITRVSALALIIGIFVYLVQSSQATTYYFGGSVTQTPNATCTQVAGQWAGAGCTVAWPMPTPPALVSPVTFSPGSHTYCSNAVTVHGDGVTDDGPALQTALNCADVKVEPPTAGHCYLLSHATREITFPANRNLQCDTTIIGGVNPQSSVCFSHDIIANTTGNQEFGLLFYNVIGGSVTGCSFRGTNYSATVSAAPTIVNTTVSDQFITIYNDSTSALTYGQQIFGNDFNGSAGYNGDIEMEMGAVGEAQPSTMFIGWNTHENCGYRGTEMSAATHTQVMHETNQDCSEAAESFVAVPQEVTWAYNMISFPFGTQQGATLGANYNNVGGGGSCKVAGAQCTSAQANDYSTNTVMYNYVTANVGAQLQEQNTNSAVGGTCSPTGFGIVTPALYYKNTCAGSCTILCPPGYPGSNQ